MHFSDRFICKGVDISIHVLLSQGSDLIPPCLGYVLHPRVVPGCLTYLCCVWLSSVARSCATRDDSNKDNVFTQTISAGINHPPPSRPSRIYPECRAHETNLLSLWHQQEKHVASDVAFELYPMVLPLRQLGRPCFSRVTIGGVDECQDVGYQGAGGG